MWYSSGTSLGAVAFGYRFFNHISFLCHGGVSLVAWHNPWPVERPAPRPFLGRGVLPPWRVVFAPRPLLPAWGVGSVRSVGPCSPLWEWARSAPLALAPLGGSGLGVPAGAAAVGLAPCPPFPSGWGWGAAFWPLALGFVAWAWLAVGRLGWLFRGFVPGASGGPVFLRRRWSRNSRRPGFGR